jgi:hypothetical protein
MSFATVALADTFEPVEILLFELWEPRRRRNHGDALSCEEFDVIKNVPSDFFPLDIGLSTTPFQFDELKENRSRPMEMKWLAQ